MNKPIRRHKESTAPKAELALQPSVSILVTLGSIAVHVEEYFSPSGHPVDKTVIEDLLRDPKLKEWIAEMTRMGFMPIKRG